MTNSVLPSSATTRIASIARGVIVIARCIAAAVVEHTKKAGILQSGNIVPLTNPIRIAEEYAMLDVQSGGRLIAGFMRGVVTHREGTGKSLRKAVVPMAGKTGTAEEVQYVERDGQRVRTRVDHAWFTGFAPYEAPDVETGIPKIAIAVLVENGGSGGSVAAPIAGAIVEAAVELGLIDGPPPAETSPPTEPPGTTTPSGDSSFEIRWISN